MGLLLSRAPAPLMPDRGVQTSMELAAPHSPDASKASGKQLLAFLRRLPPDVVRAADATASWPLATPAAGPEGAAGGPMLLKQLRVLLPLAMLLQPSAAVSASKAWCFAVLPQLLWSAQQLAMACGTSNELPNREPTAAPLPLLTAAAGITCGQLPWC